MTSPPVLADRRHLWAFVIGCIAVTLGVLLHLPMFWMGRDDGFRLADMPMDAAMLWGMALIVGGIVIAGFGLVPKALPQPQALPHGLRIVAPEDAPLGWAHWRLMIVLTIALVIDVMKPASLGFVVPGMTREYEVARTTIAWLPFAALCGTVVGSVLWGWLADLYGRRASILLSAVMFVGTAICGAMPSLWWNVGMCFLMGAAAGGMLPVAYALLAETMPSRHRGWVLVLVGGLGAVGGYLAASACAAWLEPIFSWRVLWFMNLPTGLVLILLNAFIPESPKFLLKLGRIAEMRETLRGFGCIVSTSDADADADGPNPGRSTARASRSDAAAAATDAPRPSVRPSLVGPTWALSIVAVAWGLVNFGLLLWMPAHLVAKGYSMRLSSELLAASALIALPTVFVAALLYSRWSSKGALLGAIVLTALGLGGVVHLELAAPGSANPVWPIALLIIGINGIIAMLLPYAAESYPLAVRGRATGWVAACTKGGGLVAQLLSLLGLVPSLLVAAVAILAPLLTSLVWVAWFCRETRGRDLRELEAEGLAREPITSP